MKLVLLPGMDGTGILFGKLLPYIKDLDVLVIPLPDEGAQDYVFLSEYIMQRLPNDEFIMVAESFSGGIAAIISRRVIPNLQGIIFVASFLSTPQKFLAKIASYLPLHFLAHLPFSSVAYKQFFLGKSAKREDINQFKNAIDTVSVSTLKLRLNVISQAKYDGFKSSMPVIYIGATQDKLVSEEKRAEFFQAYSDVTVLDVDGPHFILQIKPKLAAVAILKAVNLLIAKTTSSGQ